MDDEQELQQRFKFICKKCGSDNVVLLIYRGFGGTDITAPEHGEIVFGCNNCKDNDYRFSV